MDEQTPRERLRAKIYEKKKNREKYNNNNNNTSNFSAKWTKKGEKVLGFRKQQEFGLKTRIKP